MCWPYQKGLDEPIEGAPEPIGMTRSSPLERLQRPSGTSHCAELKNYKYRAYLVFKEIDYWDNRKRVRDYQLKSLLFCKSLSQMITRKMTLWENLLGHPVESFVPVLFPCYGCQHWWRFKSKEQIKEIIRETHHLKFSALPRQVFLYRT